MGFSRQFDHGSTLRRSSLRSTLATFVKALKQRGLLDTPLVHWSGEFGRLSVTQNKSNKGGTGRDHNGQGFSMWLAGGSVKGVMTFGKTDDFGHRAVENMVTPNDYQATLLHLFGLDYRQLIYHHNGQEQITTSQRPARVVSEILDSSWSTPNETLPYYPEPSAKVFQG